MTRSEHKKRILWDACCFIAILRGEQEHLGTLLRILNEAREGRLQLVASTMAITEVIRPKGQPRPVSRDSERTVREFFENDYINIRAHDRFIAEFGRDLCWDHESLKPRDAIHLSTALQTECSEMHTMDPGLLKLDGEIHGLLITVPRWSGQREIDDFIESEAARGPGSG